MIIVRFADRVIVGIVEIVGRLGICGGIIVDQMIVGVVGRVGICGSSVLSGSCISASAVVTEHIKKVCVVTVVAEHMEW